ncbi:endo-1,4-beta-xylanase [Maribacter sp. M208]|uniref:endo-1,4-beta-xylanase n=1 Tax=Maribacter huludaoensis TaxID=3030010 RepID=UPI0023ECFE23|nr:endo-1,4-beta-xylanase [Maribacter huludaoensis]MDF4223031.1 endo-1,4-beta-xylanase [Maribacter huludaoensis]
MKNFKSHYPKLKPNLLIAISLVLIVACNEKNITAKKSETLSLKEAFKNEFVIGAAVNDQLIFEEDSLGAKLAKEEFNTITPENSMKWMYMEPQQGVFEFETADRYIDFSTKNNIAFIGHNLVWHSQLAEWVKKITSKEELNASLKNHVQTIAARYTGKIHGWDVVNEALNEDGTLRNSLFLEKLGPDYLVNSFKWAEEADPKAELYYNDYNMTRKEKRAGAIELVKMLQKNGARVDGIGMQAHWGLTDPTLEEIETSILAYADLGIQVMITEFDITVLPNPWDLEGAEVSQNFEGSEEMNPYTKKLPDSVSTLLAKRYKDIFSIFKKHSDKISRVTFWGINDGVSWLNNWPIENRTNYPLLFDREYNKKPAYYGVLEVATDSTL